MAIIISASVVNADQSGSRQAIELDQTRADLIFYNGDIYTIDHNFAIDEAIAIAQNKVLDTGTTDDIMRQFRSNRHTQLIDLQGKAILPGLIEGHTHIFGYSRWNGYGIKGAQELAFRYGFTTLNEKWSDDDLLNKLQKAESNGTLQIRVNLFPSYNSAQVDENDTTIIMNTWFLSNDPIIDAKRLFRIPGIKIFVDGAFTPTRGAWAMSQPLPEQDLQSWLVDITDNPYGTLYLNQTELEEVVSFAQNKGYQVAFHAMGDRALDTVVNAVGNVTQGANSLYRHQIEHNSYIRPDVMDKFVQVDTIHSLRAYFPICSQPASVVDNFFAPGYFNRSWYGNRFALPANGLHVFLETDFAFTHAIGDKVRTRNIDPFLGLFGMVTRSSLMENGTICKAENWLSQHVITLEQALRILTIEGAYAVRMENYIGSLEKDKFADMIVIPDSPAYINPDELKDLFTLLTMVNGDIVYEHNNSDLVFILASSSSSSMRFLDFDSFILVSMIPILGVIKRKKISGAHTP